MIELLAFGLFIAFGVLCLVVWPVLMHPTLSPRKKMWLSFGAFMVLVPLGIVLYLWLGVPQMARYD